MVKKPAGWIVKLLNLYFSLQLPALLICLAVISYLYEEGLSGFAACLYAAIAFAYAATAGLIWKVVYHLQSIDEKMIASTDNASSATAENKTESEGNEQEKSSWLNR